MPYRHFPPRARDSVATEQLVPPRRGTPTPGRKAPCWGPLTPRHGRRWYYSYPGYHTGTTFRPECEAPRTRTCLSRNHKEPHTLDAKPRVGGLLPPATGSDGAILPRTPYGDTFRPGCEAPRNRTYLSHNHKELSTPWTKSPVLEASYPPPRVAMVLFSPGHHTGTHYSPGDVESSMSRRF